MWFLVLTIFAAFVARGTGEGSPPPCSVTPSVVNGDFESGFLTPWSDSGSLPNSKASVTARSDGQGLAAQLTVKGYNQTGGEATIVQDVTICRASIYNITVDYNLLNIGESCGLYVEASNNFTRLRHLGITGPITNGTGWQTATTTYRDYSHMDVFIMIRLECMSANDTADAQIDNVRIIPSGSVEPNGCPGRVPSLENGGFETGQLAPWEIIVSPRGYNIISPGYKSEYALEIPMDRVFASTIATVAQYLEGEACVGYNYTTTFAVNWGNYSYETDKPFRDGCRLALGPDHCTFYSTGTKFIYPEPPNSGWHEISYTCIAGNSVGLRPYFQIRCLRLDGTDHKFIPYFSLMLDGVSVDLTSQ